MGANSGTYTRSPQTASLFDEKRRFVQTLAQAGMLGVDADWNDYQNSYYLQLRRLTQSIAGNGTLDKAFNVKESEPTPAANDFLVEGDYSETFGPEVLFVEGHAAKLFENSTYLAGEELNQTLL